MQLSKTQFIVLGMAAIILVYALYYKVFIYVDYYAAMPRALRYAGRFFAIVLVYGTGWYFFNKLGVKWLNEVWNFIYLVVIIVLILLAGADVLLKHSVPQIRSLADTLHEFLISPVLYAGLLIVNRMLGRA